MRTGRTMLAAVSGLWLVLATATTALAAPTTAGPSAPTIRCNMDELIPAADRADIEALALKAAGLLVSNDPDKLINMLVPSARTAESAAFSQQIAPLISGGEPKAPNVVHSYMIRLNGAASDEGAICGDPTRPLTRVRVATGETERQAYAVVSVPTINNDIGLVMVFQHDDHDWRLFGIHMVILGVSGRSTEDLAKLARAQALAGKRFNASMLYSGALATLDRGPNMSLLMKGDLEEESTAFQRPPELASSLPFAWTFGEKSYLVKAVNIMGLEGGLTLQIQVILSPWTTNEDAVRESRVFVEAFIKDHPEWREVFDHIVLQAISPAGATPAGGLMYGTVYSRDKGFLADD